MNNYVGPNPRETPWEIAHGKDEHHAWYQRAFVPGDLIHGQTALGHYVVRPDGRADSPLVAPRCESCGEVPLVTDLTGIARDMNTGERAKRYWPPEPTNPATCWWCNAPGLELVSSDPPLCRGCAENLRRY